MHTEYIPYEDEGVELEGFAVYPAKEKRPLVILCHAWCGRGNFISEKAKEVASWGYIAFALDMYGKDVLGKSKEENAALKKPFIDDRNLLQRRVLKAFETASQLPHVDHTRIAVIGFGFGGICALDLARSGSALKGAVSIYGHFNAPKHLPIKPLHAKILALHGFNDPIVTPEEVQAFEKEMSERKADWQVHIYGNTMHAFANPKANDPAFGTVYNPLSAQRAWRATERFLQEIF